MRNYNYKREHDAGDVLLCHGLFMSLQRQIVRGGEVVLHVFKYSEVPCIMPSSVTV